MTTGMNLIRWEII